ncbi:Tor complex Tor2 interacting protein 1 [Datura stramonium]|uniref:Tor complex Tor2 interacting protein 1 n=1 Tax=Datura stramonium TaxID=4076 RepID=A0ABS8RLG4_DATST|nr:Tor complex Tor2 interacting protein 1 [Datura stramonium]
MATQAVTIFQNLFLSRGHVLFLYHRFHITGTQKMEEFCKVHMHPQDEAQHDVSSFHAQTPYPYHIPGVMNHVMMPSTQIHQNSIQLQPNHANSAMLPQYNHMLQYPHMHGMSSYPFYPMGMFLQPGQLSTSYPWHSFGSSSSAEIKVSKVDHREIALMKFRQKKKERCFYKKIRYVNRKQLAAGRPRGQFVGMVNGMNVDLNGQHASADNDDVEEEEEDEQIEYPDSSQEDDL